MAVGRQSGTCLIDSRNKINMGEDAYVFDTEKRCLPESQPQEVP